MGLTEVDKEIVIPLIFGLIMCIVTVVTLGCCEHSSYEVPQENINKIVSKYNCTTYELQTAHFDNDYNEGKQGFICDGELIGWFWPSSDSYFGQGTFTKFHNGDD